MRAVTVLLLACLCIGSVHSRDLAQLVATQPAAAGPAAIADPVQPAAGAAATAPTATSGLAATTPAATAGPVATGSATAEPAATAPAATGPTSTRAAAAEPAAAAKPAAKPAAAAAAPPPATTWTQRDGYVPLPKNVEEEEADNTPAAKPAAPALPPANNFGAFTTEPPAADPTGTNVFADPKYAPAAVRQAVEADTNPVPESVLPSAAGASGAGVSMPAASTPGALGGGMPATGAAAPMAGDSVFANTGTSFNNRYTPSVGNAIGSSDVLAKMIINAPEQQVAASGDVLRAMLANITGTPIDHIFVYQTRTINNAAGQPSLDLTLLFKNNVDMERTRQENVLLSPDITRGFTQDVAKQTGLQIVPGTIKTASAVNDGGAATGAAMPGSMMPGALPGAMPGTMLPGFGMNGTYPAAAAPAAPAAAAPGNAAGRAAVHVVMPLLMLAALAVL